MHDTSDDIKSMVTDAVRRQAPLDRMRATFALSESMRAVSLAALRRRFPDHSVLELVELLSGESQRSYVRHGPCVERSA